MNAIDSCFERLREMLSSAPLEVIASVATLETTLRENLREEGNFGSNETIRSARARVIHELNRLTLEHCGVTFSETCQVPSVLINDDDVFFVEHVRRYLEGLVTNDSFSQWTEQTYVQQGAMVLRRFAASSLGEDPLDEGTQFQQPLQDIVEANNHLVLLGEPGQGKTTFLEQLILARAKSSLDDGSLRVVPILIPLSYYAGDDTFLPLLRAAVNQIGTSHFDQSQIERLLERKDCLLLFDGLNEIPETFKTKAVGLLNQFMWTYPRHSCVVTCRVQDYQREFAGLSIAVMSKLTDQAVVRYLKTQVEETQASTFWSQLPDQVKEIARTPIVLCMLCKLQLNERTPPNRSYIYTSYTDAAISNAWKDGVVKSKALRQTMELYLSRLAYEMQTRGGQLVLPLVQAEELVEETKTRFAGDLLAEAIGTGLIRKDGSESFVQFTHQSFQEFFTAKYTITNARSDLEKHFNRPHWLEVLKFVVGITEDASELVTNMALHGNVIGAASCIGSATYVNDTARRLVASLIIESFNAPKYPVGGIEALGEIGVVAELELINGLEGKNPRCRRRCAYALGLNRVARAVPDLISHGLVTDDRHFKYHIIRALGDIGSANAIDVLFDFLFDEDVIVSGESIIALVNYKGNRLPEGAIKETSQQEARIIPLLLLSLSSEEFFVRAHAAQILGRMRCREALPLFLAQLKDPERRARYAAIQGLADIGDDSAVAPLLDHLLREHEDDIEQYYIMVALDRMQQNPEDLLIQAVRNRHRPEGERLRAAAVLKRWGTLSTLSMLRSAIEKSGSRDEVSSQILRGTIAAIETRFELI